MEDEHKACREKVEKLLDALDYAIEEIDNMLDVHTGWAYAASKRPLQVRWDNERDALARLRVKVSEAPR